jgi:hypothetical protein
MRSDQSLVHQLGILRIIPDPPCREIGPQQGIDIVGMGTTTTTMPGEIETREPGFHVITIIGIKIVLPPGTKTGMIRTTDVEERVLIMGVNDTCINLSKRRDIQTTINISRAALLARLCQLVLATNI